MSDSLRDLSPERWASIQRVLALAWEAPAPERDGVIAEACGDDARLAEQVRLLCEADAATDSALSSGLAARALRVIAEHEEAREELVGERVGHYRLVRKLGEGGMGVVYLGERADGAFEQRVAVKLLRGWVGSDLEQHRFRMEQQVLASLDHPAIASLYDAGRSDDGRAWFVMEYVEGQRITEYCRRHALDTPARLRLLLEVARALQYAHGKLIVHRDVKPSNILVDDQGRVKLLDFGIAKLIGEGTASASVTRSDERPMTIEYAAPEQIRGRDITIQTDVYQLGIVMFELLTGRRPFRRSDDLYEIARIICDRGATRPSVAARELAGADRQLARRRERQLSGDLDAIVMRAVAREPQQRYGSMEAFAADLEAWLAGRPVGARAPSLTYAFGKFLRRHPWASAAAMLIVALLAGWAVTATVQSERTRAAYELARAEEQKAQETAAFLESIFRSWDPKQASGERILVRDLLEKARARLGDELHGSPEVRARLMAVLAGLYQSVGLYEDQVELARDALELRRGQIDAPDARLVENAALLAHGLTEIGQLDQARAEYEYALAQAQSLDDTLGVASIEGKLAFVLASAGALTPAEQRYEQAIGLFRDADLTDEPAYAETLSEYAKLLTSLGGFERALDLNQEAIEITQRRFGRRHQFVASMINQRGYLMNALGRIERARELHEEALGILLERLEPNHEYVASTRIDLAKVLADSGELEAAREHLVAALAIRREVYGEQNAHVAEARFNLGDVLTRMDDLAGAEAEYRAATAIDRELFGDDHANVGMDLTRLAAIVHRRGELGEAGRLYRDALARLPVELVFRSTALFGYGKVLLDLGDAAGARVYLEEALEIRRAVVPAGHPRLTEVEEAIAAL